jgi:hypothetical protein
VSRRTTIALLAPLVAPLVTLGLALAGCGVGKNAQVLKEHTGINGVNVNLAGGAIQVRNVYATPTDTALTQVPAGGTLALHFHVFNNGQQPELMVAHPPATLNGPGAVAGAITIPPLGNIWVGGPSGGITGTISPISQAVFVGTYVPVTLSFSNAGHVDLTVPVEDGAVTES